jgi:ABC-type nitrate/sulfonate/bicarbonate transport system substrate-binding protein
MRGRLYLVTVLVLATVAAFGKSGCAQDKILMSYGGFNETAGPLWVGMEKGFFKKYGLDVSALQVRNGQVSLSALMSGDVQAFWPAISSVLSGVSGGAKIGCVASPFNKIARELVVRKGDRFFRSPSGKGLRGTKHRWGILVADDDCFGPTGCGARKE